METTKYKIGELVIPALGAGDGAIAAAVAKKIDEMAFNPNRFGGKVLDCLAQRARRDLHARGRRREAMSSQDAMAFLGDPAAAAKTGVK